MQVHTLGGRIRAKRKSSGQSQAELALEVGVVVSTLWRWENGRSVPRKADLRRLALALGVDDAWLADGDDPTLEAA